MSSELSDVTCRYCEHMISIKNLRKGAKTCAKKACKCQLKAKTKRIRNGKQKQTHDKKKTQSQTATQSSAHEQRATTSSETTASIDETAECEISVEHIRTTTQVDNGQTQVELRKVEVSCYISYLPILTSFINILLVHFCREPGKV